MTKTIPTTKEHRGFTIFLNERMLFSIRHDVDAEENQHFENRGFASVKAAEEAIDELQEERRKVAREAARFQGKRVLASNGVSILIRGIHATTGSPLTTPATGARDEVFYGVAAWVGELISEKAQLKQRIAEIDHNLKPVKVGFHFSNYRRNARDHVELAEAIDKANAAAVKLAPETVS